jgi:DNA mismatch repair protein MutS
MDMTTPSSKSGSSGEDKGTPLMRQYNAIKAKHRDSILFFRMGDFYEMFCEDARVGAEILGIALTSRNNGRAGRVPLAGIPVKAAEEYLNRLVQSGHKVAVCEQVEDPRSAKGIVKREVVEVITPGTIMAPGLLSTKKNNFIAALYPSGALWGLAYCDLSTGEYWTTELESGEVKDELARIEPAEIVIPEEKNKELGEMMPPVSAVTRFQGWAFGFNAAEEELKRHFEVVTLDGYGCGEMETGVSAAGGLLAYIREVQPGSLNQIKSIRTYDPAKYMILDQRTIENLELLKPLRRSGTKGTLLGAIDRTVTPMGGRLIKRWILQPLMSINKIHMRQFALAELFDNPESRKDIQTLLKGFHDLERVSSRIATGRASPRDFLSLKESVGRVPGLLSCMEGETLEKTREVTGKLQTLEEVIELIEGAFVEDPPTTVGEGGLIRDGYDPELDRLREIAKKGKEWIAGLQEEERQRTGISSLKVGFNKVFGYYIEVSNRNLEKVQAHYIRKQTLVAAERFVTEELKEREVEILGAEEKANVLEYEIFTGIRERIAGHVESIQELAGSVARLDVLSSLSEVAYRNGYCRPVVNESGKIMVREGRHPVVELLVKAEHFVPNDICLDAEGDQIVVLTGPNMAGKSTYLRQAGLIVLMAQMGSFVPARSAEVGVADRIFTRVGAVDDLAGGQSTFLVEMTETANILNNASPKSLILLDEIGRGTSTFDGLSIAWAVTEHLATHLPVAARTVFATHYHELTELASRYPQVKNCNVIVKEWKEKIIFLRKIEDGRSDRSYGVEVARIAGLPREVVSRAREILHGLETGQLKGQLNKDVPPATEDRHGVKQMNLFEETERRVIKSLKALALDEVTPLEALNMLSKLKKDIE